MHGRVKPPTFGVHRLVQRSLVLGKHEAAFRQHSGAEEGQQRHAELPGLLGSDARRLGPLASSLSQLWPWHILEHFARDGSTMRGETPNGADNELS